MPIQDRLVSYTYMPLRSFLWISTLVLGLIFSIRLAISSCPGGTGGGGGGGGVPSPPTVSSRTVIDNEQGSFFNPVPGLANSAYGFFIMITSNSTGATMAPQAIKEAYSRIEGFAPLDDNGQWPYFPYAQFKSYEAAEIAAGRNPLFMTATWEGVHKPIVIVYDLFLDANQHPTTPSNTWHYAVNVGDSRFIKFWLNNYIRPIFWARVNTTRNVWVGLDETPVKRSTLGIIDNSGKFVSNAPWDAPFPQTDQAYTTAMKTFFDTAHSIAPDIRLTANVGGLDFPTQFGAIFGNQPGTVFENFWDGPAPVAFIRNFWTPIFQQVAAYSNLGKVTEFRMGATSNGTDIRSATCLYELVKGPNSFFGPMVKGTVTGYAPSAYQSWLDRLGNPTAVMTATPEPGARPGYDMFSRTYDNGIVYLNWTGTNKVITLPSGTWVDSNGSAVSSLTIADGAGAFVTHSATRVARPQISPRYGNVVKGPLSVTITDRTAGATIRYTTDGTAPTPSSPVYGGALTVSSSQTIKAIAFSGSTTPSAMSTAAYSISNSTPVVQFDHPSDSGRAASGWGTLAMNIISTSAVTVNYSITGPSSTSGTVTIFPDDNYAHLQIPAGGSLGQSFTATLTSASGATIGGGNTYTYTIATN